MQKIVHFVLVLLVVLVIVFCLIMAAGLGAQEPPKPPKPEPVVTVPLHMPGSKIWWKQPIPVIHRTADHSYWFHVGAQMGATVLDFEYTQHVLANGGRELNPILGPHPSRARMYGIAVPVQTACDLLAWKWKREDDALNSIGIKRSFLQKWFWAVDPITAAHVGGFAYSESTR